MDVRLLGGFSVRHDDAVIEQFRPRKVGSLLAYLTYFPQRFHTRQELADRFWGDLEPEAARHNLRQTLLSLRRLLEPPGTLPGSVLFANKIHVRLQPSVLTSDVRQFDALARRAATATPERKAILARAIALYQGELLPGYFDDWIFLERDRLHVVYQNLLRQQTNLLETEGVLTEAITAARQWVNADTLQEESHHELIRLYVAAGQQTNARRQYQNLSLLLRDHFDAVPSPATQALVIDRALPTVARKRAWPVEVGLSGDSEKRAFSVPTLLPPPDLPESRLPAPLTRFFGRETEIQRVLTLLTASDERLVTLTGMGGGGKTRLAIEAGRRLADDFAERVLFTPLAALNQAEAIPAVIAETMGIEPSPTIPPFEQIVALCDRFPVTLILDNFEHLASEGASLIRALLERARFLKCLVTSRHQLSILGERVLPVAPLEIGYSRALFIDRARCVKPDFDVTEPVERRIDALCHRLEGIPLAIELAATRVGVLSIAEIQEQLEDRFSLLVDTKQDVSGHRRSLRATVEWSFRLLSEPLRETLKQLSVFRGGWTIALAQSFLQETPMQDFLQQLLERSLVLAQERGDAMRFWMQETIREYAADQLSPDETLALRARHAAIFRDILREARPNFTGSEAQMWVERLEIEHDNLRAALVYCQENEADELEFVQLIWMFWYTRGYFWEAREALARALERDNGKNPALRVRLLIEAGTLAWYQGEYRRAHRQLDEALEISRREKNYPGIIKTLGKLGLLVRDEGDYALARAYTDQSLAAALQESDRHGVTFALYNLGSIAILQGDYTAAETLLKECVALRQQSGDIWGLAYTRIVQGDLACALGQYSQAEARYGESRKLFEARGEKQGLSNALHGLGKVALAHANHEEAQRQFQDSLRLRQETGNRAGCVASLIALAAVAIAQNRPERAAVLLAAADTLGQFPLAPAERALCDNSKTAAAIALGEPAFSVAWLEGVTLTAEAAYALALVP